MGSKAECHRDGEHAAPQYMAREALPLMDSRSRTAGAVPVWNAVNGNWEPSNAVQALQTELEALKSRVAALEAAAEEPPSA